MENKLAFRKFLAKGFWPFTPDPGEVGAVDLNAPAPGQPLTLLGNSRFTLALCKRLFSAHGARLLFLDTGGLELAFACQSGQLDAEKIKSSLPANVTVDNVPDSGRGNESPSLPASTAYLPFPVWEKVYSKEVIVNGWKILPCPASVLRLPLFLMTGNVLSEKMKVEFYTLKERLAIALMQAALFLLIAVIPLLFAGWGALLIVVVMAFLHQSLMALVYPWQPIINRFRAKEITFTLLVGVVTFGTAFYLNSDWISSVFLMAGMMLISGWFQFIFLKRVEVSI